MVVALLNGTPYKGEHAACVECQGVYKRDDARVTRQVKLGRDVLETGVECPHCGCFHHFFFTTPELRLLEQMVDGLAKEWKRRDEDPHVGRRLLEARSRYHKRFKEINDELRAKTGVHPLKENIVFNRENG